ncbi:MAG: hypothetical protein J5552_05780 [Prevotella sp.]|nr:hypothetical protein [Prevotella sp.]
MKKLILTSVVLLMAMMAQAQTKIAPKLQNGFKAVYISESSLSAMGKECKMTDESEYVVSNVTDKGAVITVTTKDIKINGDENDITTQLLLLSQQMFTGVSVQLITNADGQVTGVKNLDEVKNKAMEYAGKMIDKLLAQSPEVAQAMPKETLMKQLTSKMTEEAMVAQFSKSGVLALNGKTVTNGATENYEGDEGMKMKRMYFVVGKNIITNSTLDMQKDDLKNLIIKQVEEQAPEQAEMIKQNIDLVMGQMKFEMSEKSTYQLQDNGWVKSVKNEVNQNMMGQVMKATETITLK